VEEGRGGEDLLSLHAVRQAEKDAVYSLVASMRLEKEGGLWV